MSHGDWMASTSLSAREKWWITKAWNRRAEKVARKFTARKHYLVKRVEAMEDKARETSRYILLLRRGMLGEITVLIHNDEHDEGATSAGDVASGARGAQPLDDDEMTSKVSASSGHGSTARRARYWRC